MRGDGRDGVELNDLCSDRAETHKKGNRQQQQQQQQPLKKYSISGCNVKSISDSGIGINKEREEREREKGGQGRNIQYHEMAGDTVDVFPRSYHANLFSFPPFPFLHRKNNNNIY